MPGTTSNKWNKEKPLWVANGVGSRHWFWSVNFYLK